MRMSFNDRLDPNQRFHVSVQPGMSNESSDGGKMMKQRYYLNAYAPLYDVAHKKALGKNKSHFNKGQNSYSFNYMVCIV